MAKCSVCGKTRSFGHNVSHAKNRTNRAWKPNLQRVAVVEKGETRRVMMCSRCMRTQAKTA
jgi:large subunit ribosomal protein L28